jgi:hypothetical protein
MSMTQPGSYESGNLKLLDRDLRSWRGRSMSFADLGDRAFPYTSAIVLVLVAFAIRYALDSVLLERSPLLIFTAAIVIAAGRYGTAPGLLEFVL